MVWEVWTIGLALRKQTHSWRSCCRKDSHAGDLKHASGGCWDQRKRLHSPTHRWTEKEWSVERSPQGRACGSPLLPSGRTDVAAGINYRLLRWPRTDGLATANQRERESDWEREKERNDGVGKGPHCPSGREGSHGCSCCSW